MRLASFRNTFLAAINSFSFTSLVFLPLLKLRKTTKCTLHITMKIEKVSNITGFVSQFCRDI